MELKTENKLKRLEACRKVRQFASQTCLYTFQKVLKLQTKVSEVKFRNIWLKEIYRSIDIIGDGWYDPPPNGIAVLFGNENDYKRINYPTLRPKSYWPKFNNFLKKDGLGYIFASPYIMIEDVPVIGDFGFTFYLGTNKKIQDHFKKCYKVLLKLLDNIKLGMNFSDVYKQSIKIIEDNKLKNNVFGITDKAGTDLGHTIPFIDRNPDEKELLSINSGHVENINSVISKARVFDNEFEKYIISENCAFTFEPRFISDDNSIPMFSLHTIVQFVEGKKVIADYFKGIFDLLGMQWLNS